MTQIAQPVIQPDCGPIARVTQEKLVPQSWSARSSTATAFSMKTPAISDFRIGFAGCWARSKR